MDSFDIILTEGMLKEELSERLNGIGVIFGIKVIIESENEINECIVIDLFI